MGKYSENLILYIAWRSMIYHLVNHFQSTWKKQRKERSSWSIWMSIQTESSLFKILSSIFHHRELECRPTSTMWYRLAFMRPRSRSLTRVSSHWSVSVDSIQRSFSFRCFPQTTQNWLSCVQIAISNCMLNMESTSRSAFLNSAVTCSISLTRAIW